MIKYVNIFAALIFLTSAYSYSNNTELPSHKPKFSFKENKGQVGDQFSKPRPDVLFVGSTGHLNFYLKNNGISYQMSRVDSWKEITDENELRLNHRKKIPAQTTIYRLDINWLNTNLQTKVIKENLLPDYDNYYSEVCPNGITGVRSYKGVRYQNLYKGIDLKWYEKNGNLKYDYVVAPGIDHAQIQFEIKGAQKISVDKDGSLLIETPLGTLTEKAPYVTQNGKILKAKWSVNATIISFDISNVDPTKQMVIDPLVRLWGTYYGGSEADMFLEVDVDSQGNIYATGYTDSQTNIATVGSHQTTWVGGPIASGSTDDAILVKFNSAGVRLWGTYYGGTGGEYGNGCAVDHSGNNVLMMGNTSTSVTGVMATSGSHQDTYGGSSGFYSNHGDIFLTLFNNSGVRQWATYYGGSKNEFSGSCAFDVNGDIYISGQTLSTEPNSISTPGSHQLTSGGGYEAFVAKFTVSGVRQWGTYYGGTGYEGAWYCQPDGLGNLYVVGNSQSFFGISTPGTQQFAYAGGSSFYGDCFIVKFNSSGSRLWGTYYGGVGDDITGNCALDSKGDLYVSGISTAPSKTVIPTAGAHQTTFGGLSYDAFLLKLAPDGNRIWCTFYGGKRDEVSSWCDVDHNGNVYLFGASNSTNAVSTPCSYQENNAGLYDAFIAKFDPNGTRLWGTYYGGTREENCIGAADHLGNVYLAGGTESGTGIASQGSQQDVYSGTGGDAFLVKFDGCIPNPINTTVPDSLKICFGRSTQLSAGPNCDLKWFDAAVGGVEVGDSSVYITPTLVANTTYYVSEGSCGSNTVRAAVTVTVDPPPSISIDLEPKILCYKTSVNAKASGAVSYTWYPDQWISCTNCSDVVLSPLETMEYCVEGVDSRSCLGKTCTTLEVNFSRDHNFSLPNAFTPNDDGINDVFCLKGWDKCNDDFKIMIFNRWGEKVFQSSDPAVCWDGIFKGQLLSSDVYIYSVTANYKDQTKVEKKGNITLIR